MAWNDDKRAKAVSMYQDAEPTPANSLEIAQEIADELDESVNGVRMILVKAGVWQKKEEGSKASSTSSDKKTGGARVSKEASQAALKSAIESAGGTVDEEIISKLTGKAAVYFTGVLAAVAGSE